MSETPDTASNKGLKSWEKPMVTQIDLSEDELGKLRASDNPMALLLKMKPELGPRTSRADKAFKLNQ